MKAIQIVAVCLLFSPLAKCQKAAAVPAFKQQLNYTDSADNESGDSLPYKSSTVNFINSSPQPLWFFYWYVEDVMDASNECQFRRFWKQLAAGNNPFVIPENKTLIFRICTGAECRDSFIKQYGIVHYRQANNEVINIH